ncbi:hypothetical protein [Geminocystis sp. NIES-3709]|uniref:hypothetical protein n=1 Tax=Geminocystis sp. NIES-3709 TaxID=1617448 RepID=UPI0005FCA85E|nr:hypothetical protein [Geminocystis sp. NIES-3709]BAQ64745.1 hypothetical protein GM3709_1510 [Geminocystis sp. NIES-3709]
MNQLLISLLLLTGFVFNFTVNISPVLSHEGHSHCREKDKSKCINNPTQFTKDNDDKKDEDDDKKEGEDKEENHEEDHQH